MSRLDKRYEIYRIICYVLELLDQLDDERAKIAMKALKEVLRIL